MRTVIERLGSSVDKDGYIHYDDRPRTYEEAEKLLGESLDRRRNYAIIDGQVCEGSGWFSQVCTGCEGCGCDECGYTGKRRTSYWVPIRETWRMK